MKLIAAITGLLFLLLEKGSSTENPQENPNEAEKLLMDISEKIDHWDQFFANLNQLSSDVINNDDKDLHESLQICKSNQEQINSLLEKISGGESSKETLPQLQQKLNDLDSKFEMVSKSADSNPAHAVLLKKLDKKLSRLQYSLDRTLLRSSIMPMRSYIAEDNPKSGTPQGIEEMLMDIVTKVDALYDKSTAESAFDNPQQVRHLGKSCKMLAAPYKKLLTSVDNLQRIVKELGTNDENALKTGEIRNSAFQDIRNSLENILEEIQILKRKNERNINENERILRRIDKKLDSELEDDDEDDEKLKKSLKKYMIEQRRILEKNLKKILKDKDDDDDDDDDDDSDDSDDEKRKNKSKKRKTKDDDDEDDDDDDDSDSDDKDTRKRKKNKNDNDDDDDDDINDDDDNDDDDVICDDSDENGSKSCEREKKKAYSRGKKKSKFDAADSDSDSDDVPVKEKKKGKNYKVKKDVREIEPVVAHDENDKLVADEPVQNGNIWSILGMHPPDVPSKPNKMPDVTP